MQGPLNERLRQEQHHLCCYCESRISHFQGDDLDGAHNEHLFPQHPPDEKPKKTDEGELDYKNIYACCNKSRECARASQHCGAAKANQEIRKFIREPQCENYFTYNSDGEILPKGEYIRWNDYLKHEYQLLGDIKEAYQPIKILNLNDNSLLYLRKEMLRDFMEAHPSDNEVQQWLHRDEYPEFISMLFYSHTHQSDFEYEYAHASLGDF